MSEAYTDADVDRRVADLMLTRHADGAETIDCPVCECPVSAAQTDTLRRYGAEPDFTTGLYGWGWSPVLFTLSCGHRIELGSSLQLNRA